MNQTPMLNDPSSSRRLAGVRLLVLFGGSYLFGQERANIEVMRVLRDLGAGVRFITNSRFGPWHIQPELDKWGFSWTSAPFGFHWSRQMLWRHFGHFILNLYGVLATSWRLLREARQWKPTHIYTMNWTFFVFAWPALRLIQLPLVFRAGDVLPRHTAFHRWICRRLRQRITSLVCNSQFVADSFRRAGLVSKVIYNYPPARRSIKPIPELQKPEGATAIIYVGQIAEHKGVGLLVRAVIAMIGQGRNVVLWIVGASAWGDPLEEDLRADVAAGGVFDRIQFLDHVDDVPSVLRRADIHVCPSLWNEPSPNVIFEAKREGLPSVTFSVGGIPELVEHKVDGYICLELTPEALTEGLDYFIGNPKKMKEAGRAASHNFETRFGFDRFERQWAEVITEA